MVWTGEGGDRGSRGSGDTGGGRGREGEREGGSQRARAGRGATRRAPRINVPAPAQQDVGAVRLVHQRLRTRLSPAEAGAEPGGGRARGRQGVGDAAHRRRLTAVALHSHRGRSHWAAPAWPGSAHGPAPCERPRYRGRLGLWASSGFSRQAAVGELSLRLAPSVGEQASALQKLVAGRPCPVGFRRLLSASRAALPGSLASTPGATPRVAPRRAPAPRAPWRFPAAALLRSPVRLAWNLHFLPSA